MMQLLCQDPIVSDWSPRKGPRSGGTLVVVTGSDLHYGSTLSVMMNRLSAPVVRYALTGVDYSVLSHSGYFHIFFINL